MFVIPFNHHEIQTTAVTTHPLYINYGALSFQLNQDKTRTAILDKTTCLRKVASWHPNNLHQNVWLNIQTTLNWEERGIKLGCYCLQIRRLQSLIFSTDLSEIVVSIKSGQHKNERCTENRL